MSTTDFFCAICGASLSVDPVPGRHLIECPCCAHLVPVPAAMELDEPIGVFPRGVLALDVSFLCPACDCRLQIDARWEGRRFNCPKCRKPVSVPHWSRRHQMAVELSKAELEFLTAGDACE